MKFFLDNDFPEDFVLGQNENETDSEAQKNLGGRPLSIDEGTLFNRRDSLIQMLSNAWEIGWELACARTPESLRKAFGCLKDAVHEQFLRPFLSPTIIEASASDIRATKKDLGHLVKRMYELMPKVDEDTRRLRESGWAVNQNIWSEQLGVLVKEHILRLASFRNAAREMDHVQKELKTLETRLADQEAYYAQHELLKFIGYGKYAHNPRNLAQAMAGLPQIGCWQSFQRCEKQPSPLWPTRPEETPPLSYQVFEIIAECWNHRDREPDKAFLNLLRDRIRPIPQSNFLRSHLTEQWRYLRQAVEQTNLKQTVLGAVPYRVFGKLMKNIAQPRSAEESVLAAKEQRDIEEGLGAKRNF